MINKKCHLRLNFRKFSSPSLNGENESFEEKKNLLYSQRGGKTRENCGKNQLKNIKMKEVNSVIMSALKKQFFDSLVQIGQNSLFTTKKQAKNKLLIFYENCKFKNCFSDSKVIG